VHKRFAPGLHASWLLRDVAAVAAAPCALAVLAASMGLASASSRVEAAFLFAGSFGLMVVAALIAASTGNRTQMR